MFSDIWYKNAIVYSLSVGSFLDSNGDGVGDFHGLEERLDYLQGLGVTTIWLMPFQRSPRRDHGYDIVDHYSIDRCYGTLGDFVAFTHAAAVRGLRIIIDLVINHTSDQHPWFQSARSSPDSSHRDWYLWSKEKPANADEGMVFPGVQETTWTWDDQAQAYYFHRFYKFQPDLNTANPAVQEEILKIMGFWIQLGVSGFRMDAVPFIIMREGANVTGQELQFGMLRDFRAFAQWRRGDVVLLAEANVPPEESAEFFGRDGDRMHMMFNFAVNQRLFYGFATGDARPVATMLKATRDVVPDTAQWGIFLRNHDELDLGRLSEEQRNRVFEAFAPDPSMRLYGRGIRRRLAPMLGGDRRRLELAYSLLFTLPGTPVLYYGDEIGMGEDLNLPERDACRTPMQWSGDPQGGFTTTEKPVHPVIDDGDFGFRRINVARQRRDPESLLNWMERIMRMRKECPEIGLGTHRLLDTGDPALLALRYDWRDNALVVVHNFAGEEKKAVLEPGEKDCTDQLVNVLSDNHSDPDEAGRHHVTLEPYGYRWFRLGRGDHLRE
ncbi:trehalose synthase [Azospirillum sp. RWY-5-1]|uniref:Trehalose synthase n=1 Tax=Azospirillum oleiclasticum TaxID=2735135 RepID=A0ABX2TA72_9PROT|nr:alpha-amylase family protein [Azospirillum oleiclasticum]NYZ13235.1 trehalose synthase [Azospirillum oleiclasticum]NYZ20093.1 trehalose synthase [Azospirillum oleiclasticum]